MRGPFKLIHTKEERNGPPSANQGHSTAEVMFISPLGELTHLPCFTLSVRADPIPQGHCWE